MGASYVFRLGVLGLLMLSVVSSSVTDGAASTPSAAVNSTVREFQPPPSPPFAHPPLGIPGKDFPIFHSVPVTSFKCIQHMPGYYADVEGLCQVFHICQDDGRQDRFLCPNGTLFSQNHFVCDWWYNVDCSKSPSFYHLNSVFQLPTAPLSMASQDYSKLSSASSAASLAAAVEASQSTAAASQATVASIHSTAAHISASATATSHSTAVTSNDEVVAPHRSEGTSHNTVATSQNTIAITPIRPEEQQIVLIATSRGHDSRERTDSVPDAQSPVPSADIEESSTVTEETPAASTTFKPEETIRLQSPELSIGELLAIVPSVVDDEEPASTESNISRDKESRDTTTETPDTSSSNTETSATEQPKKNSTTESPIISKPADETESATTPVPLSDANLSKEELTVSPRIVTSPKSVVTEKSTATLTATTAQPATSTTPVPNKLAGHISHNGDLVKVRPFKSNNPSSFSYGNRTPKRIASRTTVEG